MGNWRVTKNILFWAVLWSIVALQTKNCSHLEDATVNIDIRVDLQQQQQEEDVM